MAAKQNHADCIEELIQEEIYDKYDKEERLTNDRARKVAEKWKSFVVKKREARKDAAADESTGLLSPV